MTEKEHKINVANDEILVLSELDETDLLFIQKEEVGVFIRTVVHDPVSIGWPNASEDFARSGVVLQALDEKTARVVLVVDDERARKNLSLYAAAYAFRGFTLHIDEATYLRPPYSKRDDSEASNSLKDASPVSSTQDSVGMEVA